MLRAPITHRCYHEAKAQLPYPSSSYDALRWVIDVLVGTERSSPEVHLPGNLPMKLCSVQLKLLAEAAEAGALRQVGKLRQHQLRMQVRMLSLAARLLRGKPALSLASCSWQIT